MTETGVVQEIRGNVVIIAPDMSAACFGCMNHECRKGGRITAENTGALPLEKGQTVEVKSSNASLLGQALAAFLPPLLGFIAGYTLIRRLFPGAPEGAAPGAGVLFLFAAAFFVYLARKKRPAGNVHTVTRVVR